MKKLIKLVFCLVVFVVTWKTWEARINQYSGYLTYSVGGAQIDNTCIIADIEKKKEFSTKTEAERFAEETGNDRKNWDVKIWRMEESK